MTLLSSSKELWKASASITVAEIINMFEDWQILFGQGMPVNMSSISLEFLAQKETTRLLSCPPIQIKAFPLF